ncbi:MAG: ABC transporter substrate-binding protein [Desulforhopalus sp.]
MLTRLQTFLITFTCLASLQLTGPLPGTAEPIKIGAIFALSGKAQTSNKPAILGVELAVREINEEGGVLGRNVELLLLDNNSTPIGSHIAAEKAAMADVTAIIGSVWSSHSLAIAKVAEKYKIPMISTNSTIPSLTTIGDHIFRVCYDDNFQGTVMAEFAFNELGARTALVFVDIASDFSLNLTEIFGRTFQLMGGKIVKEIEYKTGQADYLPQIREALAHDTDIVFLSGHDEGGVIADELQKAGVHAIPIGNDGWDVDSFFDLGGHKIKQGFYITHWTPLHADPLSQAFIKKYANEGEIKASTALAYDAVHVLAAAIRKAASTDSAAIRNGLHSLAGFRGITGEISFDQQGNATKQACMMEIRKGAPYHLRCHASD